MFIFVCKGVGWGGTHVTPTGRGQGQLSEVSSLCHHVGPRDRLWVRLCIRPCLYC